MRLFGVGIKGAAPRKEDFMKSWRDYVCEYFEIEDIDELLKKVSNEDLKKCLDEYQEDVEEFMIND